MLIRISLIVAILAALAAGVLNFVVVKDKITTLATDRDTQKAGWLATTNELTKTKKNLTKTQGELKQTQNQLADANAERDKAVATADTQKKRADDLNVQLTKTAADRDDAQNKLAAYTATSYTPDQIAGLGRTVKDQQAMLEISDAGKSCPDPHDFTPDK